jgi:5,10-methylenetetrahydrofolate reductase
MTIASPRPAPAVRAPLVEALSTNTHVVAVELRPPRTSLGRSAGMDAWIDTYHAVRMLARRGTYVLLTDSAVGAQEEDNLRHLVANLGRDVPRTQIVPFLTAKHSLEYCLGYADRAVEAGFPSLVVLGGDTAVGAPRCVEHAWQLRQAIHARQPSLALGGWANPHRDAGRQVEFLLAPDNAADFALTQVVSHHQLDAVEAFQRAAHDRVQVPVLFGVFYYRSANAQTLRALSQFLPVPVDALREEFATGASPVDVCARTVRALFDRGIRHVYISNLPLSGAHTTLQEILKRAGV